MEKPPPPEQVLLSTLADLGAPQGRRVRQEYLIRAAAERSGLLPEDLQRALMRLRVRGVLVEDISNRILFPSRRGGGRAPE